MIKSIRITSIIILLVAGFMIGVCGAYTPPKGIPNPSTYFSTFGEIDKAAPGRPASWNTSPTSATAGYYYIDKTHPNRTSSGFGHPDAPRSAPPEGNLPAGTYIYINAGTYTSSDPIGGNWTVYGQGTASNPIWIRGNPANRPVLQVPLSIGYNAPAGNNTSYIIVENLNFTRPETGSYWGKIAIRPTVNGSNIDHIIVRNCTLTGGGKSNNLPNAGDVSDGGGIGISLSSSSDLIPDSTVQYIVIYNVLISRYGYVGELGVGGEECGIYNAINTDYVWILDSTIHSVGADSIAGSHYSNDTTRKTEHYFIGRNTLYGNGENGIDLKGVNHTVISENEIYGPFQDEQGWGIALHGGPSGVPVKDAWVLFNKIYRVSGGVYSTKGQDIYYIGNIVYDVANGYAGKSDPWNGACFMWSSTKGDMYAVDNTCYEYEMGAYQASNTLAPGDNVLIQGNIFYNRKATGKYDINAQATGGTNQYVSMDYNRMPSSSAFLWGGTSRNLAYMKALSPPKCEQCAEGSPGFVSPPADFKIQAGSPCVDSNIRSSVYDKFFTSYGVDIKKDIKGTARPQGSGWDIGAYELSATVTAPAPAPVPSSGSALVPPPPPAPAPDVVAPPVTKSWWRRLLRR